LSRPARDEYIEIDLIVPCLYLSTRLLMDLGKDRSHFRAVDLPPTLLGVGPRRHRR